MKIPLLLIAIPLIPLFGQTAPYPRHSIALTTAGTSVPASCIAPDFFVKTDSSTLYVCVASTFVLIGGSGTTTVNGQSCAIGSSCTVADATKQPLLGFTAEDVANKSTTTALGASDTLYPSQNAVKTYVDVRGLRSLAFTFDGSGIALTTGKTTYLRIPFACTIVDWSLGSTTAETVTIKTWKIASGTAVPTVANSISTSGVSLSTGTAVRSATLSDFTSTTVAANDWIAANITAVTASQYVVFQLGCQQ